MRNRRPSDIKPDRAPVGGAAKRHQEEGEEHMIGATLNRSQRLRYLTLALVFAGLSLAQPRGSAAGSHLAEAIGGGNTEQFIDVQPTSDGGYVACGQNLTSGTSTAGRHRDAGRRDPGVGTDVVLRNWVVAMPTSFVSPRVGASIFPAAPSGPMPRDTSSRRTPLQPRHQPR